MKSFAILTICSSHSIFNSYCKAKSIFSTTSYHSSIIFLSFYGELLHYHGLLTNYSLFRNSTHKICAAYVQLSRSSMHFKVKMKK